MVAVLGSAEFRFLHSVLSCQARFFSDCIMSGLMKMAALAVLLVGVRKCVLDSFSTLFLSFSSGRVTIIGPVFVASRGVSLKWLITLVLSAPIRSRILTIAV